MIRCCDDFGSMTSSRCNVFERVIECSDWPQQWSTIQLQLTSFPSLYCPTCVSLSLNSCSPANFWLVDHLFRFNSSLLYKTLRVCILYSFCVFTLSFPHRLWITASLQNHQPSRPPTSSSCVCACLCVCLPDSFIICSFMVVGFYNILWAWVCVWCDEVKLHCCCDNVSKIKKKEEEFIFCVFGYFWCGIACLWGWCHSISNISSP